jgi:hypothetical protein
MDTVNVELQKVCYFTLGKVTECVNQLRGLTSSARDLGVNMPVVAGEPSDMEETLRFLKETLFADTDLVRNPAPPSNPCVNTCCSLPQSTIGHTL